MYQVRCRRKISAQVSVVFDTLEDFGSRYVTVLADERVDLHVIAKTLHTRRDNDQPTAVCNQHARAVDSFVCQPGLLVFTSAHGDHDGRRRSLDDKAVDCYGQLSSCKKGVVTIAGEEATHFF